jgi:hypothetical protein
MWYLELDPMLVVVYVHPTKPGGRIARLFGKMSPARAEGFVQCAEKRLSG